MQVITLVEFTGGIPSDFPARVWCAEDLTSTAEQLGAPLGALGRFEMNGETTWVSERVGASFELYVWVDVACTRSSAPSA